MKARMNVYFEPDLLQRVVGAIPAEHFLEVIAQPALVPLDQLGKRRRVVRLGAQHEQPLIEVIHRLASHV